MPTHLISNLASMSHSEFVELLRENGRGSSRRTQQGPSCIGDTFTTENVRFETPDSIPGPSSDHRDLGKHDNTDLTATELLNTSPQPATVKDVDNNNQPLTDSGFVLLHDNSNSKPAGIASKFVVGDLHCTTPTSSIQLLQPSSPPRQASPPLMKSRVNSSQTQLVSLGGLPELKIQEQDPAPDNKMGLMNFSHFLRPVALVKANNIPATRPAFRPAGLSTVRELRNNDRISASGCNVDPVEQSLQPIEPASISESVTGFKNQPVLVASKVDFIPSIAMPRREPVPSDAVCQENGCENNRSPNQGLGRSLSFAAGVAKLNTQKSVRPSFASSAVHSRTASNDPASALNYQDTEETCPSAKVEEPKDVIKAVPTRRSSGAKSNRTAEMHDQSERRQRYQINKKMRVLQELIPNCNKVDKASMLDEAIEYLKTLQRQIQIMSMGTGLWIPPVLIPTRMQQLHPSHLPPFSIVGVGMGMRMGMGICCRPPQFVNPPIFGATAIPAGIPTSVSRAPSASALAGAPAAQSVLVPCLSGDHTSVERSASAARVSKDSIQGISSEMISIANVQCSRNKNIISQTSSDNPRRF